MQSQQYFTNYKCECYGQIYCNCPHKEASNSIFLDNVYSVAEAMSEIMVICGIHPCKAKASVNVVIHSFLHYDEIRHRIDAVPHKRLCKEDLIHDLGRKCLMNRMEAQLSYSIIKRAFKAFYHGTTEGGIRNPLMEAQLIHTQECMWVHAAKRTAQIFASYEGMFFSAQNHYEQQIRCVYKRLYDRLRQRADPLEVPECNCVNCLKRAVVGNVKTDYVTEPDDGRRLVDSSVTFDVDKCALLPQNSEDKNRGSTNTAPEQNGDSSKMRSQYPPKTESTCFPQLPRCYTCNCPKLMCDCNIDRDTGVVSAECSQGPYKCQWIRVDNEEPTETNVQIPEDHECPVDCDETSVICDPECECVCESCECVLEDNSSPYEDNDEDVEIETKFEEEVEIEMDGSELSKYMGCCMINHLVEEERFRTPVSIAKVIGHIREASVTLEYVPGMQITRIETDEEVKNPPKDKIQIEELSNKSEPAKQSKNIHNKKADANKKPITDEEKRQENEEIMKILGHII